MQIEKKVLLTYLNGTAMTGAAQLNECIVDFGEEGVTVMAASGDNCLNIKSHLKKEAFINYEAIGQIGMNELPKLAQAVAWCSDYITIIRKPAMIQLLSSDDQEATKYPQVFEFCTLKVGFIQNILEHFREKEGTVSFDIECDRLKKFFGKIGIVSGDNVELIVRDGELLLKAKGYHGIEQTLPLDDCGEGEVSTRFGKVMMDSIINLEGVIHIRLRDNFPIQIEKNDDKLKINLIVAPMKTEE